MKSCQLLGKGELNFNFDISSIIFLRYAITVWYMDDDEKRKFDKKKKLNYKVL